MKKLFIVLLVFHTGILVFGQRTASSFNGEEEKIMEVIEKETLSFFLGEYVDWKNCWVHSDDIYFEWVRSNVHHFYTSWSELDRVMRPIVTENVSSSDVFYSERTEIQIVQDGDLAWVNYRQDLSGDKSNEQRVLRKINGDWKISMVTVVASETFPKFEAN